MSKVSIKQKLQHSDTGDGHTYSQEFESLVDSKSKEDKITCFVCKQQIPKSQALSHNAVCKKLKKKNTQEVKSGKRKYSPIRETEDEHNSKKDENSESSDNYSSSKFEESQQSTKHQVKRFTEERKSTDYMRDSYMSSSMSTEKPITNHFAKQVADFMKGSASQDDFTNKSNDDDDESSMSRSNENSNKADLQQMLDKYKKMQELLAKYNSGEYEESVTLSKST